MNDDFKFTGARYFLNIPSEVGEDPRLHDKSKLIFGQIFAMLNVTGKFYMSNKEIAKRVNAKSVSTVKNCLAELEEYGYIKRKNIYKGKEIVGRQITSDWNPWSKKCPTPPAKKLPQGKKVPEGRAIKCPLKEHLNKEEEEINKKENLKSNLLQELKRFAKCEPNENEWQIVSTLSIRLTYDSLRMVTLNFMGVMHDSEIQKPYAYLIKMMRDELENQKLR